MDLDSALENIDINNLELKTKINEGSPKTKEESYETRQLRQLEDSILDKSLSDDEEQKHQ